MKKQVLAIGLFFVMASLAMAQVGNINMDPSLLDLTSTPVSVRVDFQLGNSEITGNKLTQLQILGQFLKDDSTAIYDYLIEVSVDDTGWVQLKPRFRRVIDSLIVTDHYLSDLNLQESGHDSLGRIYELSGGESFTDSSRVPYKKYVPAGQKRVPRSKNESDALNAAELIARVYAAVRAMDYPINLGKVQLIPTQKERFVRVTIFKKTNELGDLDDRIEGVKTDINFLKQDIDVLKVKSSQSSWSILAGWQGMTCGQKRDLSVPMAGLRFNWRGSFVQILAGINPWSSEGYNHYWYRDILGAGTIGYNFYESQRWVIGYHLGGLIGWEFTSETNEFSLQMLGLMTGLGVELKIVQDVTVCFTLDYAYIETSDVTPETGKMRNGIYGSAFIRIF